MNEYSPEFEKSVESQRQVFGENLLKLQETLSGRGIDYRIIGSIGAQALLGDSVGREVQFDRPGAIKEFQKMPDIDLIVPRDKLEEVRQIREDMLEQGGPKVGLANATAEIDFRPGEENSFLTHKGVAIPIRNELLKPEFGELDGIPVRTLSPDTLLQTYGTFGGIVRRKDMANIRALVRAREGGKAEELEPFREFRKKRRELSPREVYVGRAVEAVDSYAPGIVKNALGLVAIRTANILKLR